MDDVYKLLGSLVMGIGSLGLNQRLEDPRLAKIVTPPFPFPVNRLQVIEDLQVFRTGIARLSF